jgi:DNA-binding GntR family transcriptional regulator
LKAINLCLDRAIEAGDASKYMYGNHCFHFALYQVSQSQIMLPTAETLWLRFGPLSRIICGKCGTGNLVDRHEEALIALRQGNSEAVAQAIKEDIMQGISIVRRSMA